MASTATITPTKKNDEWFFFFAKRWNSMACFETCSTINTFVHLSQQIRVRYTQTSFINTLSPFASGGGGGAVALIRWMTPAQQCTQWQNQNKKERNNLISIEYIPDEITLCVCEFECVPKNRVQRYALDAQRFHWYEFEGITTMCWTWFCHFMELNTHTPAQPLIDGASECIIFFATKFYLIELHSLSNIHFVGWLSTVDMRRKKRMY